MPEVEEDEDMPEAPDQARDPSAPDQAAGSVQSEAHQPSGAPAPAPPPDAPAAGDPPRGTENAAEQPQPAAEASTLHRLAAESPSAGNFGLEVRRRTDGLLYLLSWVFSTAQPLVHAKYSGC